MDYISETKMFVNKLKETKQYVDYLGYKNVIESNPQLLEKVNEYRKKSFEIHSEYNEGSYECYENILKLNDQYKELLKGPGVMEFLNTELELSKIISSIYNCIASEIDLDISFLE